MIVGCTDYNLTFISSKKLILYQMSTILLNDNIMLTLNS